MPGKKYITIFVTCGSKKEAQSISRALVSKGLAACGNITGGIDSIFTWKGKVRQAKETMLILKTRESLFKKAALEIRRIHSYEVPEIIAMPILKADKPYLDWIDEVTKA
ncbi:MAG: divalent-cation tolerance protein CutA [Candidatus Omnitrophota bacterium]